jgi:hypothetical protein
MSKKLLLTREFLNLLIEWLDQQECDAIEYDVPSLVEDIERYHGANETDESRH